MSKIIAQFIVEISGKPKEKVDQALEIIGKKLEENFKVQNIEIEKSEPDENNVMFHGLIDVSIKFNEIKEILNFIIDYTPTSIEIIEPEELELNNSDLNEILNDLSNMILKNTNELRMLRATVHHLNSKLNKK
jgi:hypothetical protein